MNDMRAAFEAWAATLPDFAGLLDRYSSGEYKTDFVRVSWRVWQAARTTAPLSEPPSDDWLWTAFCYEKGSNEYERVLNFSRRLIRHITTGL